MLSSPSLLQLREVYLVKQILHKVHSAKNNLSYTTYS